MFRISQRTGVTELFYIPLKTGFVLRSLWRRRYVFPDLPKLFWKPSMVLVKDCEVKMFPFIFVVSSLWQFPSWWEFAAKPGGYQGSCAGCCSPAFPASQQQGGANPQNTMGCLFVWMLQHITDIPTPSQLGHTEQWERGCEGVPGGLVLILGVCEAP